jgi:5'(3')-deoxyribonucleotidase
MDGVVADFNAYAEQVLNKKTEGEKWPEEEWRKLTDNPRLYRDLAKTPEADDLVGYCEQFTRANNMKLLFLTAVPKGNDVHWAFYDKVCWASFFFPMIPVHFGPYSKDKHVHCTPGDILIDDRTSNIEEWRAVGGIAIHYKGNLQDVVDQLNEAV